MNIQIRDCKSISGKTSYYIIVNENVFIKISKTQYLKLKSQQNEQH